MFDDPYNNTAQIGPEHIRGFTLVTYKHSKEKRFCFMSGERPCTSKCAAYCVKTVNREILVVSDPVTGETSQISGEGVIHAPFCNQGAFIIGESHTHFIHVHDDENKTWCWVASNGKCFDEEFRVVIDLMPEEAIISKRNWRKKK